MVEQEDAAYLSDSKFRSFNDDLTTVLNAFDRSKEWADLIKWCGRVDKVLEKYVKFPLIPQKLTLAKRLAQCMNPALPSGVHLKALDTYEVIFARMGADRLARDLPYYCTGIFPLFQNASTQVKPRLLNIYEKYYLPLKNHLIPCLPGLVLSLLPGLEETGTDLAERVMKLLDSIRQVTYEANFYHVLWRLLVTTPYVRNPTLVYLNERLPKAENLVLADKERPSPFKESLVVKGLVAVLQDNNVFVLRLALDILVGHFRLDRGLFGEARLIKLVGAAMAIIIKKDVSLNRRLYSWLLGTGENVNSTHFFEAYSKKATVRALADSFEATPTSSVNAVLPFKILAGLLEKDELGQCLGEAIVIHLLKTLRRNRDSPFNHDIRNAFASVLKGQHLTLEMIWKQVTDLIENPPNNTANSIGLLDAFLDVLETTANHSHHLLILLWHLTRRLPTIMQSQDYVLLFTASQMSIKIVGKIKSIEQEVVDTIHHTPVENSTTCLLCGIVEAQIRHYVDLVAHLGETPLPPDSLLHSLNNASNVLVAVLRTVQHGGAVHFPHLVALTGNTTNDKGEVGVEEEPGTGPAWLSAVLDCCNLEIPLVSCFGIRTFIGLASRPPILSCLAATPPSNPSANTTSTYFVAPISNSPPTASPVPSNPLSRSLSSLSSQTASFYLQAVVQRLWALLHSSCSDVHYEVAQLFCDLREIDDAACSATIAEAMLAPQLTQRVEAAQRFALLWRLTSELGGNANRPFSSKNLFLMLDSLHDDQPMIRLTGRTWLADSINKAARILDPLLAILLDKSTTRVNGTYQNMYDARRVVYVLRVLKAIIECDFQLFMKHVTEKPASKEIMGMNEIHVGGIENTALLHGGLVVHSYIDLLVVTALRFIQGVVPDTLATPDFRIDNSVVQISAAEFLQYLLVKITDAAKAASLSCAIQEPVLQSLAQAVSDEDIVLQVHLLALLRTIVMLDVPAELPTSNSATAASPTPPYIQASPSSDSQQTAASGFSLLLVAPPPAIASSPMFLQTLVVGLLQPSSKNNIRFYWLDFITSCVHRLGLSDQLPHIIAPLARCLCSLLESYDRSLYDSISARDIHVILKALMVILNFVIFHPPLPLSKQVDPTGSATAGGAGSALGAPVRILADFVKDVFTGEMEPTKTPTPLGVSHTTLLSETPMLVSSLLKVWGPPKDKLEKSDRFSVHMKVRSVREEHIHNKYGIQDVVLRILEPLAHKFSVPFMNGLLDLWQRSPPLGMVNSHSSGSLSKASLFDASAPTINPGSEDYLSNTQKIILEVLGTVTSEESVLGSCAVLLTHIHSYDRHRTSGRPPSQQKATGLRESAVFDFVQCYIEMITADGLGSATFAFFSLMRGALHSFNPSSFIVQLHILSLFVKKVVSNPNVATRKLGRKDLQDIAQRLVESCFLIAGKSFSAIAAAIPVSNIPVSQDREHTFSPIAMPTMTSTNSLRAISPATVSPALMQSSDSQESIPSPSTSQPTSPSSHAASPIAAPSPPPGQQTPEIRTRNNSDPPTPDSPASTPVPPSPSSHGSHGSSSSSSAFLPNAREQLKREASVMKSNVSRKALSQLAEQMAPLLDMVFDDKERIVALLIATLHHVLPYLRGRGVGSSPDHTFHAMCLLASVCEYPYTLRAWRKEVMDIFTDADFFKLETRTILKATKVINQLMLHDRTAFTDIMKALSKSLAGQASMMFVSREHENLQRARHLRRMSFAIWSGTADQYTSMLPTIQEKLVDALKIVHAPVLHVQVFLCLRVLLLRIAPASLRGFWPVILTEMMDIFTREEADPALIVAACKFLDLVLVLPSTSELFNLYEWMFITEGLETVLNPVYIPFVENLADKLARTPNTAISANSKNPATAASAAAASVPASAINESSDPEQSEAPSGGLRRPVITVRTVCIGPNDSNLFSSPWFHTFLSRFSRAAYQGGLAPNAPDMEFIALLLAGDFSDLESEGGELSFPNATATVLDIDEFEIVDVKPKKKQPTSPEGLNKWVNVNYKKDSDKEISVDKGSAQMKESIDKETHHTSAGAASPQETTRKNMGEQLAKFSKPIFTSPGDTIISGQRFSKVMLTEAEENERSLEDSSGSEKDFARLTDKVAGIGMERFGGNDNT